MQFSTTLLLVISLAVIVSIHSSDCTEEQGKKSFSFDPLVLLSRASSLKKSASDSEVTGEHKAKSNKVSRLLHLIRNKSKQRIYGAEGDEKVEDQVANHEESQGVAKSLDKSPSSQKWTGMSDDEVIAHACDDKPTKTCAKLVQMVQKRTPEVRAKLAEFIRNKPANVNTSAMLIHHLYEYGLDKFEEMGYDEKLDKMIDVAAMASPYGRLATKALNFVV